MPATPPILYHYTDAAGLIAILSSCRVWATHLEHMNDSKEDHHGSEVLLKYVRNRWMATTGDERHFLQTVNQQLRTTGGGSFRYAFCLSEDNDSLSQWRAYSQNGGYAIGFKSEALTCIAQRNGLTLSKCIYDEADQLAAFDSALSVLLAHHESWDRSEEQIRELVRHIRTASEPIRSSMKHWTFSEEREWRVHGPISASDPRSRWRASGPYVRPFAEIPLHREHESEAREVIAEVCIGPGVDAVRARSAATHMMIGLGYKSVDVRVTASPFRR